MNPMWVRAWGMLGAGESQADVARQLGVNRNTIHAWMEHPDFKEGLERARSLYLELGPKAGVEGQLKAEQRRASKEAEQRRKEREAEAEQKRMDDWLKRRRKERE